MNDANASSGELSTATRRKFPPVGHCIYCGAKGVPLTDEHIIPEGLGGRDVLQQASCSACQTETCRFEGELQRDLAWALRLALGMRGKRRPPQEIPTFVVDETGERVRRTIDHSLLPVKGLLPVFLEAPGILTGASRNKSMNVIGELYFDPSILAVARDAGIPGTSLDLRLRPFARCLAKIGHSMAVAQFGADGFTPYLCDIIRGTDETWAYYVGCVDPNNRPADALGNWVTVSAFEVDGVELIVGRVRLFASIGAPIYDLVIGERRPLESADA